MRQMKPLYLHIIAFALVSKSFSMVSFNIEVSEVVDV